VKLISGISLSHFNLRSNHIPNSDSPFSSNITLSGLKSLTNDLQLAFNLPGASASLKLALGDLQLDARQETNVTLFQNHSLIASEDFFLRLQDISIQISFDIANIWPWIKLDISKVEFRIDASAFKFEVYSDNAAWNGEPIDFDRLNKLITVISKVVLLSLEPLIEDFLAVNVPVWFQVVTMLKKNGTSPCPAFTYNLLFF